MNGGGGGRGEPTDIAQTNRLSFHDFWPRLTSCVFSVKEGSCSSLVLMYAQALLTVKRETTSKETIVSSLSIVISVIVSKLCGVDDGEAVMILERGEAL